MTEKENLSNLCHKNLCHKINNKMNEVKNKTPKKCYISYKNDLYHLLKRMDASIECFNKE